MINIKQPSKKLLQLVRELRKRHQQQRKQLKHGNITKNKKRV